MINNKSIKNNVFVRIILGVIICMASVIIGQQIFAKIPGTSLLNTNARNLIKGIFVSILIIGSYRLFYSKFEKRNISELSTVGLWKKVFVGILIGGVLQSLTVLVIYLYEIGRAHV